MRKEIIFAIGAAVALPLVVASGLLLSSGACRDFKEAEVIINTKQLSVAVADDSIEQIRGLAGCKKVPNNSGMLFTYAEPTIPQFWMKGMVISIDIVWIADGKVVGMVEHVPPVEKFSDNPPRYNPPRLVSSVLELGAGKAAEYGIAVGDSVEVTIRPRTGNQ